MALLRGRGLGLEIVLADRDLDDAIAELETRFAERPAFYRGTSATVAFGARCPSDAQLQAVGTILDRAGVMLDAVSGDSLVETMAAARGFRYLPSSVQADGGEELARRRALKPRRQVQLSDSARSLVADFAGARADIAHRRQRGETSVRRLVVEQANSPAATPATVVPLVPAVREAPETLYHVGTLRGGQSLHHIGNLVVVGDVNPGAEVVATGDVVVFGALRGIAHAGAQGDEGARVYALRLSPTQLRIAAYIGADAGAGGEEPEAAAIRDGRITVVPLERASQFPREARQ